MLWRGVLFLVLMALSGEVLAATSVSFEVEVPYCTPPTEIYLRSNRNSADTFVHDRLTRQSPTRYSGTFDVATPLESFEYKYAHGICNETSCPGIEKALTYTGNGAEVEPRRLAAGVTSVSDLVFIWRDTVKDFDANGQELGVREGSEMVAFCAPYLNISSTDADITIGYDSYYAEPVSLEYGPTSDYGNRIDNPGSHRNHFVLSDLVPGQTYHYRITEGGVPGEDRSFTAAVAPQSPFRFGFLGDTQYYSDEDRVEAGQVIARMLEFEPNLVLAAGDLVASEANAGGWMWPEMGRWNLFFGVAAPLLEKVAFVTAMGNHEEDCDYYWDVFDFPEPDAPKIDHYWFRFGSVHFTVLYTGATGGYDVEGIVESQTSWMQEVLDAAAQDQSLRWKVVVLHRGHFSQGANHPDAGEPFFNGGTDTRPSWGQLWEEYGVDLVLAGHNHNFTLARYNGVSYITSCAGAPNHDLGEPWLETTRYAEKTCSADRFEVGGKTLSFSAVRPDGSFIEGAAFSLCREAADCHELQDPCPYSADWSCPDGICEYACLDEPEPPDGGPDGDEDAGPDAGADVSTPDAGGDPGGDPRQPGRDCGCTTRNPLTSSSLLMLLIITLIVRRFEPEENPCRRIRFRR